MIQFATYHFFRTQDPKLNPFDVSERSRRVDVRHFAKLSRQRERERETASRGTNNTPLLSLHVRHLFSVTPFNFTLNPKRGVQERTTDYLVLGISERS